MSSFGGSFRRKLWLLFRYFLFKVDAETAHHMGLRTIQLLILFGDMPLRIIGGNLQRSQMPPQPKTPSSVEVFGMKFLSRVGLAAGFDKNAEILTALPALGFGFVEIGTVTPRPQPGNPRPRLFRDSSQEALFNRMGFNSLGASLVSVRLARAKEKLPENFRVGVNLGKNRDTSIEKAGDDYVHAARSFRDLADYVVINVSSPNTPGLRSLQTVDALRPIVEGVSHVLESWKKRPPLLLKIAPELSGLELPHLIQTLEPLGIEGWVLTNTLAGAFKVGNQNLAGGWSGRPLIEISRKSLIEARRSSQKPIISVGGIVTLDEATARISAGADLIQLYTGWIYQGPSFPSQVKERLALL